MTSSTPEIYCRDTAAPAGSGFYYSTLYYPANIKRDLYAVHAFHREIEHIIEECSDPGVARIKLAWWQEEIQRLFDKNARHPISKELDLIMVRHDIKQSDLIGFIRHYEQRIYPAWPDSWQGLLDYLTPGPGLLWRYSAAICGYSHPDTPDLVCRMGNLFEFFSLLQDRKFHLLLSAVRQSEYLTQITNEIASCCENIPTVDRIQQQGAIISAQILKDTANEIVRSRYSVNHKITLTPFRKFWIAWQTHRKVMKGK